VAQTLERLWGSDAVEVARGVLQLVGGVDVVEQQLPILLPQALFDQQLDARGEMKDRVLQAARRVELELFDRRGEKVEGVLEQGEVEVTVLSSTHAVTVASLSEGESRASEKGWRNGAVASIKLDGLTLVPQATLPWPRGGRQRVVRRRPARGCRCGRRGCGWPGVPTTSP